jgi:hypothetical protein
MVSKKRVQFFECLLLLDHFQYLAIKRSILSSVVLAAGKNQAVALAPVSDVVVTFSISILGIPAAAPIPKSVCLALGFLV